MKKLAVPHPQQQEKVNAYFQSQSAYWKDIYASGGVFAEIHRDRHATVLAWIDSLSLTPNSQVLEIGCGAGFMAIALAQRGFLVHGIDSAEAMFELARQNAVESGTTDQLSLEIGSAYSLAFEDGSFDLVIAIGVIPWLEHPEMAIQEMARVTKPGGYVMLTADNRARLHSFLDPWLNPVLRPFKLRLKDALGWLGLHHPAANDLGSTLHNCRFIDKTLMRAGFVKIRGKTLGFGPFSFFRRAILPESFGVALHRRLQHLADQNVPGFRFMGAQYLVLARKLGSRSLEQSTSACEEQVSVYTTDAAHI